MLLFLDNFLPYVYLVYNTYSFPSCWPCFQNSSFSALLYWMTLHFAVLVTYIFLIRIFCISILIMIVASSIIIIAIILIGSLLLTDQFCAVFSQVTYFVTNLTFNMTCYIEYLNILIHNLVGYICCIWAIFHCVSCAIAVFTRFTWFSFIFTVVRIMSAFFACPAQFILHYK